MRQAALVSDESALEACACSRLCAIQIDDLYLYLYFCHISNNKHWFYTYKLSFDVKPHIRRWSDCFQFSLAKHWNWGECKTWKWLQQIWYRYCFPITLFWQTVPVNTQHLSLSFDAFWCAEYSFDIVTIITLFLAFKLHLNFIMLLCWLW